MNRYSKTKLRQGKLPRQPQPSPKPEDIAPRKERQGTQQVVQALLFDLPDEPVPKGRRR